MEEKLLLNLHTTPISILQRYKNNNKDDKDQDPGLSSDKPNSSQRASQVKNSVDQSQNQGSSGNNESFSTLGDANQRVRDIQSTSIIGNSSNETDISGNSDF